MTVGQWLSLGLMVLAVAGLCFAAYALEGARRALRDARQRLDELKARLP